MFCLSHDSTPMLNNTTCTLCVEIGYLLCYHIQYMPQIRISRTKDLESVLSYFRDRYRLLSEADIVKMVLSDRYYEETKQVDTENDNRKGLKAFLDTYHKTIPEVDEEQAERDIQEAISAVRTGI